MDITTEIDRIRQSINLSEIRIDADDCFLAVFLLNDFSFDEYTRLIIKLNKCRLDCKTYDTKIEYPHWYEMVYKAQLKLYKKLYQNIRRKKIRFLFDCKKVPLEGIKLFAEKLYENETMPDGIEVCYVLLEKAVKKRIAEAHDELRILQSYSHDYINTFYTYIGPYEILRYRSDRVFYKDCTIVSTESHSFSVSYNERTLESTKNGIVDIMAYLNGCPYFLFTENPNFNRKLSELYYNFDLLDMVRLRKKNYFNDKDMEKPIALQMPILKAIDKRYIVSIPDSSHEEVFALYHASLKQFEPLPRCVFLYRVFEYGANHHYQKLFTPENYDPKDALEYYYSKIFTHKFTPLYYISYGRVRFDSDKQEVRVLEKSNCKNYISVLKKEARAIVAQWQKHDYLKKKSIGDIIYNTGRCAAAHGSGGKRMARYDYAANYKHINDVNIVLELIARYIVEQLNPGLNNVVNQRREEYIRQSDLGI